MKKQDKGLSVWQLTMLALGTLIGGSFKRNYRRRKKQIVKNDIAGETRYLSVSHFINSKC